MMQELLGAAISPLQESMDDLRGKVTWLNGSFEDLDDKVDWIHEHAQLKDTAPFDGASEGGGISSDDELRRTPGGGRRGRSTSPNTVHLRRPASHR